MVEFRYSNRLVSILSTGELTRESHWVFDLSSPEQADLTEKLFIERWDSLIHIPVPFRRVRSDNTGWHYQVMDTYSRGSHTPPLFTARCKDSGTEVMIARDHRTFPRLLVTVRVFHRGPKTFCFGLNPVKARLSEAPDLWEVSGSLERFSRTYPLIFNWVTSTLSEKYLGTGETLSTEMVRKPL